MKRILLLAGTAEARSIASELAQMSGIEAFASLAGATQRPERLDLPTRIGGFGGVAPMIDWVTAEKIDAILDATHPFAAQISQNARLVAQKCGLPYLQVMRPAWRPQTGDKWHEMPDMASAAQALLSGQRVFLATGRTTLDAFKSRSDCWFLARVIDATQSEFPLQNGHFTRGRPPFSVADEVAVFREAGIDILITKNAGGANSKSKLIAARELGLPVLMIARPAIEPSRIVETVADAMTWVKGLCDG